ncbi:MAG TPA: class I SAM-dependent methyltransferase [Acidimicrobiales bacterium]|nr:class I SAM-dependent methyltransferase [Acidimicrobiales bacterium]
MGQWRRDDPASDGDHKPQSFDSFVKAYDRRDKATGGFVTNWLEGALVGRHGGSAIDLGCGTGDVAVRLAERYDHVTAVDLSQPMVDLARRKHAGSKVRFERGDLTSVHGQYDLVVSIMTLHHVPDLPAALGHISTLVAPGGMVVLVDAVGRTPSARWPYYVGAIKDLLRDLRRAWATFRVSTDSRWIAHLRSDEFLGPPEFVSIYEKALPGAEIRPVLPDAYAAVWHRPSPVAGRPRRPPESQALEG